MIWLKIPLGGDSEFDHVEKGINVSSCAQVISKSVTPSLLLTSLQHRCKALTSTAACGVPTCCQLQGNLGEI